jgi:hypothetical protein
MIVVSDPADFETAIRRKLAPEIARLPATIRPAQLRLRAPTTGTDCLIGERMRR